MIGKDIYILTTNDSGNYRQITGLVVGAYNRDDLPFKKIHHPPQSSAISKMAN